MYDLPHAQTHAVVLPYVLAFNAPFAPEVERADRRGPRRRVGAVAALDAPARPSCRRAHRAARPRPARGRHRRGRRRWSCRACPPATRRPVTSENLEALLTAPGRERSRDRRRARTTSRPAREEELTATRRWPVFASTPDPRLQDAAARADPAPARLPPRGPADRGGVAARHRVPDRDRAHHRRQAAGVRAALRRARRLHADDHHEQRGRTATPPRRPCSGPFFVEGSPEIELGGDIAGGATGRAVLGRGHRDGHRRPAGAGRADRGVGGRRGRLLRRPVRRRPGRRRAGTCSPTSRAGTGSGR